MTLRFVLISSLTLSSVLAFTACNPAIIADGLGGSGGGANEGGGGATGNVCVWHDGSQHAVGTTFPAGDGCNTCTCEPNGMIPCTEVGCIGEAGVGTCFYEGQSYATGQSFPAGDGCNTCTCGADDTVACTTLGCCDLDAGSPPSDGGVACFYGCNVYAAGESFPAGDGCNTCTCEPDGSVACTTLGCVADGGPGGSCVYEGIAYSVGQTFPAGDGCNTCSCAEDGSVLCTTIACSLDGGPGGCFYEGIAYAVGQSFPAGDGCNTCTCDATGVVHCTELPCAFDGGPPPLDAGPGGCIFDGLAYPVGDTFAEGDGCNTCTCEAIGFVQCTTLPCVLDAGPPPPFDGGPVQCLYNGQVYSPGEVFPSADGCNTCVCADTGGAFCTTYFCDAGPISTSAALPPAPPPQAPRPR